MAIQGFRPGNSKYDFKVVEVILRNIREGSFRDDAARIAGISPKTLYNWYIKRPELLQAIERAESANKKSWFKIIAKHAKRSWQAMAWLMERRHAGEYGARLTPLQGAGGVQIAIIGGGYTPLKDNEPIKLSDKLEDMRLTEGEAT